MTHDHHDHIDELLFNQSLYGLSTSEVQELDRLLESNTDIDRAGFERAAAAVALTLVDAAADPLPQHLRDRAVASFQRVIGERRTSDRTSLSIPLSSHAPLTHNQRSSTRRWREALAWTTAAAAILLAVFLSLKQRGIPTIAPNPQQQLSEYLQQEPDDLLRLAWQPQADRAAEGASGEVVWSDRLQHGFMIFRGLQPNDPGDQQYQLWIFDRERDAAMPVDGGVFDIATATDDEIVVPITAKLPVRRAYMFAVTIERPGGVVVSNRERLPLLAVADAP